MDLIGLNNNNFLRLYRRMMFSPFVTLGGTKRVNLSVSYRIYHASQTEAIGRTGQLPGADVPESLKTGLEP